MLHRFNALMDDAPVDLQVASPDHGADRLVIMERNSDIEYGLDHHLREAS